MFKDTREELERLQQELLETEPEPRPAPPAAPLPGIDELLEDQELNELLRDTPEVSPQQVVYQNYSNGYGRELRNFANGYGQLLQEPEEAREPVPEEPAPPRSLRGLIVTAGLLTAGIVLVLLWWLLRFGGLL